LIYKNKEDPFGAQNLSFDYDELDQLTYEETNGPSYLIHDSLNNRVQKNETTYRLNDLNQIEGEFTYDANGNTIRSSDTTYSYDALDRLIALKNNDTEIHYTYDPFHRRITAKTGHEETTYLYIGNNEVGSTSSSGTEEFRVLGQGLGAEIGAAVLLELNGQVYAPIHDHSGSIVCLIDPDSGTTKQAYRYTPFGELIKTHSNLQNPWRFASQRHDPTKLIFFGRRYYKPTLGRWITCDPLGLTDGPNLYAYVHNNPLTHFDEYGLFDDYWDMTADEAAMYDRDSYVKGATQAAGQSYAVAEDIFVGGIRDLSIALLSEGLDPSNPYYATPFSQQSFYQQAGLISFAALDVMQVGKVIKAGKKVYNLANAGVKVYEASKACKTTLKATNSFRLAKSELIAYEKGLNLNTFNKYAMALSQEGKDNIRALRGWAKSKGYKKVRNPQGRPEKWVSCGQNGKEFTHVVIKPQGSFRGAIEPMSGMPRFDARLAEKIYINPFTGSIGGKNIGKHIPLEKKYW